MNLTKFFAGLAITLLLIYLMNRGWTLGSVSIPPLGKFLDPFHGFWQNIEPKGYQGKKQLTIPGLLEPVTVVYDSLLIPHIFARNNDDLYLAQGYITDRVAELARTVEYVNDVHRIRSRGCLRPYGTLTRHTTLLYSRQPFRRTSFRTASPSRFPARAIPSCWRASRSCA